MAKAFNKTTSKKITITDAFLEKKRIKDPSDPTVVMTWWEKFRFKFFKFVKIDVVHKEQYLYRVQFKGGKLKKGDVILNAKGVFFAVAQVQRNRARIITVHYLKEEPVKRGIFHIVQDPKKVK